VCRPVRRTAGALARPPAIGFTLSQPPYRPSGPTATHAAARPLVVRSNGFIDGMNPVARGRLRRHGPFGPNGHARHLRRRVSSGPKDRRRACAPPSDRIYPIATTLSPFGPIGHARRRAAVGRPVRRTAGALARPPAIGFALSQPPCRSFYPDAHSDGASSSVSSRSGAVVPWVWCSSCRSMYAMIRGTSDLLTENAP